MTTNIKSFVKRIAPRQLVNVYWAFKYGQTPRLEYFWEGIYGHPKDVPISGKGYESDAWLNLVRSNTERVLTESKKAGTVPEIVTGERSLLPLTASLLCQLNERERLTILDFGGGVGIDYVRMLSSILQCSFDYHIVDTQKSCELGAELFKDDRRIHFHSSLPVEIGELDLVYMNSALEYVEDYKTVLETLCDYQPKCFLFVRFDAGEIPTHARGQKNIEGSTFSCWFFNIHEIINIMEGKGYSVIFKGAAEQIHEESNLPEKYRVRRACNLLFSRT